MQSPRSQHPSQWRSLQVSVCLCVCVTSGLQAPARTLVISALLFWGLWDFEPSHLKEFAFLWALTSWLKHFRAWTEPSQVSAWRETQASCSSSPEEVRGHCQMRMANLWGKIIVAGPSVLSSRRVTCDVPPSAGSKRVKAHRRAAVRRSRPPSIYWSGQTTSSEMAPSLTVAMVIKGCVLTQRIFFSKAQQDGFYAKMYAEWWFHSIR